MTASVWLVRRIADDMVAADRYLIIDGSDAAQQTADGSFVADSLATLRRQMLAAGRRRGPPFVYSVYPYIEVWIG